MPKANKRSRHNEVIPDSQLPNPDSREASSALTAIDVEHDNSPAHVLEHAEHAVAAISQSHILLEPVTGTRNIGGAPVLVRQSTPSLTNPSAQSPVLLDPVTGIRIIGDTPVDVRQSNPSLTHPGAQSPVLLEPVTGIRSIGDTPVDVRQSNPSLTHPGAQSPVLLEPVTGIRSIGESVLDAADVSKINIHASSSDNDVVMFSEDASRTSEVTFMVRRDNTDDEIVDYDSMSDSDAGPSQSPSIIQEKGLGHAEDVVRA